MDNLGKVFIITPEGEELIIDGNKVCVSSSLEQCWEEPPEAILMRLDVAYQEGWPVKTEGSKSENI